MAEDDASGGLFQRVSPGKLEAQYGQCLDFLQVLGPEEVSNAGIFLFSHVGHAKETACLERSIQELK